MCILSIVEECSAFTHIFLVPLELRHRTAYRASHTQIQAHQTDPRKDDNTKSTIVETLALARVVTGVDSGVGAVFCCNPHLVGSPSQMPLSMYWIHWTLHHLPRLCKHIPPRGAGPGTRAHRARTRTIDWTIRRPHLDRGTFVISHFLRILGHSGNASASCAASRHGAANSRVYIDDTSLEPQSTSSFMTVQRWVSRHVLAVPPCYLVHG